MCLYRVTDWQPKPTGTAYKVVRTTATGQLIGLYFGEAPFMPGEWQEDPRDEMIPASCLNENQEQPAYRSGFHMYKSLHDARHRARFRGRKVYEVEYQDAQAEGVQANGEETVIARKIKLVREIPATPVRPLLSQS